MHLMLAGVERGRKREKKRDEIVRRARDGRWYEHSSYEYGARARVAASGFIPPLSRFIRPESKHARAVVPIEVPSCLRNR